MSSIYVTLMPPSSHKEIEIIIYFQDPLFPHEGEQFKLKIPLKKNGQLPDDITMSYPFNRISHIVAELINVKYKKRIGAGWQFDDRLRPYGGYPGAYKEGDPAMESARRRREIVDQLAKDARKAVLTRLHVTPTVVKAIDQSWFGAAKPPCV